MKIAVTASAFLIVLTISTVSCYAGGCQNSKRSNTYRYQCQPNHNRMVYQKPGNYHSKCQVNHQSVVHTYHQPSSMPVVHTFNPAPDPAPIAVEEPVDDHPFYYTPASVTKPSPNLFARFLAWIRSF